MTSMTSMTSIAYREPCVHPPFSPPDSSPHDLLYSLTLPAPRVRVTQWTSRATSHKSDLPNMDSAPKTTHDLRRSRLHELLDHELIIRHDPTLLSRLQTSLESALIDRSTANPPGISTHRADLDTIIRLLPPDIDMSIHESILSSAREVLFSVVNRLVRDSTLWKPNSSLRHEWSRQTARTTDGHGRPDGSCGGDTALEVKGTSELPVSGLIELADLVRKHRSLSYKLGRNGEIACRARVSKTMHMKLAQQLLRESHATGCTRHVVFLWEVAAVFELVAPNTFMMSDIIYRETGTYYSRQSRPPMTIHSTFAALACLPPLSEHDRQRIIVENSWLVPGSASPHGVPDQPPSSASGMEPPSVAFSNVSGSAYMSTLRMLSSVPPANIGSRVPRHILRSDNLRKLVLHQVSLMPASHPAHRSISIPMDANADGKTLGSSPESQSILTPPFAPFASPMIKLESHLGTGHTWDTYRLADVGYVAKICCPDYYPGNVPAAVRENIYNEAKILETAQSSATPLPVPQFVGLYQGAVEQEMGFWWNVLVMVLEDVGSSGHQLSAWKELSGADLPTLKLAYDQLHDAGIVHGDVQPWHVFKQADGWRIIDFDNAIVEDDPEYEASLEEEAICLSWIHPDW